MSTFFGIFKIPKKQTSPNGVEAISSPKVICAMRLFEPYVGCSWAIYAFCLAPTSDPEETEEEFFPANIPQSLIETLHGGMSYPPAMAIARESLFSLHPLEVSQEDYCEAVEACIKKHIANCQDSGYLLSRKKRPKGLVGGYYYWIVSFNIETGLIEYVTEEFEIVSEKATAFEVDVEQLKRIKRKTMCKDAREN